MSEAVDTSRLRPIERRVLDMRSGGMAIDEIAGRLKRSPSYVERLLEWTNIPRTGESQDRDLRPVERRVLDLRSEGESHDQIGERFNRSARFIRQIEGLAHFKEAQRILSRS
jgi:DNA-binding CsgD family transcriptional regulator